MTAKHLIVAALAAILSIGVSTALADGKEEEVAYKDLPAKVRAAFEKEFPGATVKECEKETSADGTVEYELEFRDKDGKKREVEYNADGVKLDDDDDDDDDNDDDKPAPKKPAAH